MSNHLKCSYMRFMYLYLIEGLTALIIEVFGIPGSAGAKSGKSAALKGSGTSSSKNNAKQTVGPNAGTPKVLALKLIRPNSLGKKLRMDDILFLDSTYLEHINNPEHLIIPY
nr:uncharacterized protein LOC106686985 isoform X3 [Halyomorpha halys]